MDGKPVQVELDNETKVYMKTQDLAVRPKQSDIEEFEKMGWNGDENEKLSKKRDLLKSNRIIEPPKRSASMPPCLWNEIFQCSFFSQAPPGRNPFVLKSIMTLSSQFLIKTASTPTWTEKLDGSACCAIDPFPRLLNRYISDRSKCNSLLFLPLLTKYVLWFTLNWIWSLYEKLTLKVHAIKLCNKFLDE